MHLVLGLGNPGRRYERTRHNVGFVVVDRLAERWGENIEKKQFGALVGSALIGRSPAVLCKPQSFMNLSGQPAASLKGFYKVQNEAIVVVHDELDLPFGEVRIKKGGGHAGHNGLRDLQQKLGGNDFIRIRVGITRPPQGWDVADYVLGKWSSSEESSLGEVVERACDAVEAVLADGVTAAMNTFNTRSERAEQAASGGSSSS
ncbi:MAG: aminoacyl-tRNA hydrolase [Deltaproteobacteria bacterium]|nr:MAG: aminoacyl-tRNA hydrolase [Deltaproteobacteria bacterium]